MSALEYWCCGSDLDIVLTWFLFWHPWGRERHSWSHLCLFWLLRSVLGSSSLLLPPSYRLRARGRWWGCKVQLRLRVIELNSLSHTSHTQTATQTDSGTEHYVQIHTQTQAETKITSHSKQANLQNIHWTPTTMHQPKFIHSSNTLIPTRNFLR